MSSTVAGVVASSTLAARGSRRHHRQRSAVGATTLGLQQQQQQQHGLRRRGRELHHRRVVVAPRTVRTSAASTAAADEPSSAAEAIPGPSVSDEFLCPRLSDTFALDPLPSPFAEGGAYYSYGLGQKFVNDQDCVLLNALRYEVLESSVRPAWETRPSRACAHGRTFDTPLNPRRKK